MKNVLFLIHDLGPGGAEKVLVSLVNHLNREKFRVTVMALFGGGVNEALLAEHVRLIVCHRRAIPGNSRLMKLLSPRQLYRRYIREDYDIVVSYLEGPCARIVSGCDDPDTKIVGWIHSTLDTPAKVAASFRSFSEAQACYGRFHRLIFVSRGVQEAFCRVCPGDNPRQVLYNTNETEKILAAAGQREEKTPGTFRLCAMGKLTKNKGFDRLLEIHARLLREGYPVRTRILGEGEERRNLERYVKSQALEGTVSLPGYLPNPYQCLAQSDLFVCASHAEGFSTAVTEALILGVPVCTVEVSGMRELLGAENEWGIVTENDTHALYMGIRRLLDDPALLTHYREKAGQRGQAFRREETLRGVEEMLSGLQEEKNGE